MGRFRRLYVIALSSVAALAVAGQVLVQRSLATQHADGEVVNRAGFQRMLSQRITLKMMLLNGAQEPERGELVRELVALRDRWVAVHHELEAQSARFAFDEGAAATLASLMERLATPVLQISAIVDRVAQQRGVLSAADREVLLREEEIFLPLMDAVVVGFEHSGTARVELLRGLEFGLLTLTLVVLAVEAVFVFRPAEIRLGESLERLERGRVVAVDRLASLQRLAGGIAHHFNNLLTGIMGNAELQRIDAERRRDTTELIDVQISECERGARLINQLVAYSGSGRLRLHTVELGPWLRGVLRAAYPDLYRTRLVVDEQAAVVARVDLDILSEAIEGIVANAIDATADRPGRIRVALDTIALAETRLLNGPYRSDLAPGQYARISVTDNGVGMTSMQIERIFDPFYSEKSFGRGMGLAAVLGVAHSHDGGVEVDSTHGVGTTVTLYLPLHFGRDAAGTSGVLAANELRSDEGADRATG